MGIDHSLGIGFPTVQIHGRTYKYGKEPYYGQYIIQCDDDAKDYFCFNTADEMRRFLICLPESAQETPNWHEMSEAERKQAGKDKELALKTLFEERKKHKHFNVLQFAEEGHYEVFPNPRAEVDHMTVHVRRKVRKSVIELQKGDQYVSDGEPIRISREQALKLASVLIEAVRFIERTESKKS